MKTDHPGRSRHRSAGHALPRLFGPVALTAALAAVPASHADAHDPFLCREVVFPVTLEETHHVRGVMCPTPSWRSRPLLVLVSGASYDRSYWDFPVHSERYSFVRAAREAGFATLALDRPGTGRSDRPAFDRLTVSWEGEALHQVLAQLRSGMIAGVQPGRVVVVGHSLGSFVAQWEAARYHDVDALIVTGALRAEPVGAGEVVANLVPAQSEPRLAHVPAGYLTTRGGTRGQLFYNVDAADPLIIAADDATRDTLSPTELATLGEATDASVAAAIDVPVLLVLGERDNLWCPTSCDGPDSPLEREVALFTSSPSVESFLLAGAGHVVNLHPNAHEWFAAAHTWLDELSSRATSSSTGGAIPC